MSAEFHADNFFFVTSWLMWSIVSSFLLEKQRWIPLFIWKFWSVKWCLVTPQSLCSSFGEEPNSNHSQLPHFPDLPLNIWLFTTCNSWLKCHHFAFIQESEQNVPAGLPAVPDED